MNFEESLEIYNKGEEFDLNRYYMMTDKHEMVTDFIYKNWGESYEDSVNIAQSIERFVGEFDKIEDLVRKEKLFNRYYDTFSWMELGFNVLDDIRENDMVCDDGYEEELENVLDEDNENNLYRNEENTRAFLIKSNWALDKENGVALGFDNDVELQTQEYGE